MTQNEFTLSNFNSEGPPIYFKQSSCWKPRSGLEKKLCLSTIFFLLMSIAAVGILGYLNYRYQIIEILLGHKKYPDIEKLLKNENSRKELAEYLNANPNPNNETTDVCLTPACVEAASLILKTIDESVSPCDDFYKFACGRWINETEIPDNKVSTSISGRISETLKMKLKTIVKADVNPNDMTVFNNIKMMYKSCMNLSEIENVGDGPLLEIIDQLGGWPVIEGNKWKLKNFDWIQNTLKMRYLGIDFNKFYSIYVGIDVKNNSHHIIKIGESGAGIGGRNTMLKGFNSSLVLAYYHTLVESAILLGANKETAEYEISEMIKFQIEFVKLTTPLEESRNMSKIYNKMTVKDVQNLAPNIPWERLLSEIFNETILSSEEVIVTNPNYLSQMNKLIQSTDKRVLANHMMSGIILGCQSLLGSKWRRINYKFVSIATGIRQEPPRWEKCLSSASSMFTALSALYVRKHFDVQSKQKVHEMVTYIHNEFIQILNNVDWMDVDTKKKAKEKAQAITTSIGYPDELLDDNKIIEFYEGLEEFSEGQYFQNSVKVSKWSLNYALSQLRELRIKGDWHNYASAAVFNAYYSHIENAIIFPAGILQGQFFNNKQPNYLNYGAIGVVIGHEITHGFDDIGKQFDKDGNHVNWWEKNTDDTFKNKTQCIVSQYSNYTVPENGMTINGINTQGENIADNGGVKEAFRAYQAYVRDNHPELPLPGLKYSPNQLFWISFANIWCSKVRPEMMGFVINQGVHSPPQFRVIGTLSNLKEFSDSFNCKLNSGMNPQNKCTVW